MSNPSKRKGTGFEVDVVGYLREHGFPYAERRAMEGTNDRGDVGGIPGVVIECKATNTINLGQQMGELEVEQANAGVPIGLLVIKRRLRSVAQAYCVMSLEQGVRLIGP
jgi:hypothetical protein